MAAVLIWSQRASFRKTVLKTYLDLHVLAPIQRLSPDDQFVLARAYVAAFRALPVETEHPALVMSRWRDVLTKHARLVLGWR